MAANGGGSGQLTYSDSVAGSTWNLAAVAAAPGSSPSRYETAALLNATNRVASTREVFNAVQNAWVLHDSAGFMIQPGSTPALLGASGSGFSLAVWFRVDDAGSSNPTSNVVLQLTLSAGGPTNLTLTLLSKYSQVASLALDARLCCSEGGGATTDADYALSTSTEEFGPTASQPNAGAFSAGAWQHVALSFDGTGNQTALFWNGKQQGKYYGTSPINLGALLGAPPPYGPLTSGSLGFDVAGIGSYPLWGAIGDVQFYDCAMAPSMAQGLFSRTSTPGCAPPSPPPGDARPEYS